MQAQEENWGRKGIELDSKSVLADFFRAKRGQLIALKARGIEFFMPATEHGGIGLALLEAPSNPGLFADFSAEDWQGVAQCLDCISSGRHFHPALIDLAKLVAILKAGTTPSSVVLEQAFRLSRIRFQGTDGMRGTVHPQGENQPDFDCIQLYQVHNRLSPSMIELAAFTFGFCLIRAAWVQVGDIVNVGNDGRDQANGWQLCRAMVQGFMRAGLLVNDLGVIPTPFVPWQMLRQGNVAGAMLTASHNPADQNGIKFFLRGKKVLPEGPLGDYALSAQMFYHWRDGKTRKWALESKSPQLDPVALMLGILPENLNRDLNRFDLLLDTANGAWHYPAQRLFQQIGVPIACSNSASDGHLINAGCGVVELEGHACFESEEMDLCPPIVQEVFVHGRHFGGMRKVFAIVLDGDGDRGILLFYHSGKDRVYVLNGDRLGYILASAALPRPQSTPIPWFVTTVESDLMTSYWVKSQLDLNTATVSVGDKWMGHFDKGPLAFGVESSGHLIMPLLVTGPDGKKVELLTGNGLLSCLLTLQAISHLDLDSDCIAEPYPSGYTRTRYCFNVDKSRFFPGSPAWESDKTILASAFANDSLSLEFVEKEDPEILYAAVRNASDIVGAIFCRNSGTEEKTAVYVQCSPDLVTVIDPIGERLSQNHHRLLKNVNRKEIILENRIMAELSLGLDLTIEALMARLATSAERESQIFNQELHKILHCLKKEGRILWGGASIRINRESIYPF